MAIKTIAVAGNVRRPSRTAALAAQIVSSVASHLEIESHLVELVDLAPSLGGVTRREDLDGEGRRAIELIESADLLIAVTPVYRGSYTGLFKHVFDLVAERSFAEIPVVLAATGGSDRHALVIEHGLRPLLGFFGAHTMPSCIYATERDFIDGRIASENVLARIDLAARQAAQFFRSRSPLPVEQANGSPAAVFANV